VLAWRLSNTMDAGFCVAALEEVLARLGNLSLDHLVDRPSQGGNLFRFCQVQQLSPC